MPHSWLKNKITASVDSVEWLKEAAQYLNDTPLKVHIAVDSGMGRIGVVNEEELASVEAVLQNGPFEIRRHFHAFCDCR